MNFSIKELNELIYSLGTTATKGMFCDKELNASLLDKICEELNRKFTNEKADEYKEDELSEKEEWLENRLSEDSFPHYVSNEEADEDYRSTLVQDEQRYEKSRVNKGVTQSILDFVQLQGDATYTEMQNFYRKEFGSNSFSHILKSLIIPYKNRATHRYLVKMGNGNYEVRVAQPSFWVEKYY